MLEELKALLEKIEPDVDLSEVTLNTRLAEDLGFDSLSMMLMSMELERQYHIQFTEYVPFETVGDVCNYLESRI